MKVNRPRAPYSNRHAADHHNGEWTTPRHHSSIRKLSEQVRHECVWETDQGAGKNFGGWATNELSYCNTMIARILDLTSTHEVMAILDPLEASPPDLSSTLSTTGSKRAQRTFFGFRLRT